MKRWLIIIAMFAAPVLAQNEGMQASFANQQLPDPAQEARAKELMQKLRCIQCQGQAISDSDAPIAGAMRSEVRKRIQSGQDDASIKNWLISRYGEYVSYEPATRGMGLLLWLTPLLLLGIGVAVSRKLFRGAGS
jgi:cytochrome c-type biogenesis protein CcmH